MGRTLAASLIAIVALGVLAVPVAVALLALTAAVPPHIGFPDFPLQVVGVAQLGAFVGVALGTDIPE